MFDRSKRLHSPDLIYGSDHLICPSASSLALAMRLVYTQLARRRSPSSSDFTLSFRRIVGVDKRTFTFYGTSNCFEHVYHMYSLLKCLPLEHQSLLFSVTLADKTKDQVTFKSIISLDPGNVQESKEVF